MTILYVLRSQIQHLLNIQFHSDKHLGYGHATILSTDGVDNLDKLLQTEQSLGAIPSGGILNQGSKKAAVIN